MNKKIYYNPTENIHLRNIYEKKIIYVNIKISKMSIKSFNDEITEPKFDNFIFGNDISDNHFLPLKPFKEDFIDIKSSSGNSSITKIINNQFLKEMTDKNIISDVMDSDGYYIEHNNISPIIQKCTEIVDLSNFSDGEKESRDNQKYIYLENINYNGDLSFNLNSNLSLSLSSDEIYYYNNNNVINIIDNNDNNISSDGKKSSNENNNNNKKKIFNVIKDEKYKNLKDMKYLKKKRRSRKRKNRTKNGDIDWDNIPVPKEKHFHLDRKKKRIIFQRKYLKMIYSIVDLEYPFDFKQLFNLIKLHVGDKTATNYGNGKSFHIIKIDDKYIIVTMKEKKLILKNKKK